MNFIKQIPMNELQPGEYGIQVKITDDLTHTPLVTNDKFTVK
jgi:hypothetical protein